MRAEGKLTVSLDSRPFATLLQMAWDVGVDPRLLTGLDAGELTRIEWKGGATLPDIAAGVVYPSDLLLDLIGQAAGEVQT